MKIQPTSLCICKHPAIAHTMGAFNEGKKSLPVSYEKVLKCSLSCEECGLKCPKFKLDNLAYVEYLAKKKNLV